MRHIKHIGVALLLCGILGCATNRVAYNTLAGIKASTDAAVVSYFTVVAKGKASIKGVPTVAAAYDNFELVWSAAVRIAQFNTNNVIASPEVTKAAIGVTEVINIAKGQ